MHKSKKKAASRQQPHELASWHGLAKGRLRPRQETRQRQGRFRQSTMEDAGINITTIPTNAHERCGPRRLGARVFAPYLKFNSNEWKKYNTPMLFQNRLRHQDYRKIFKSINYKVEEIKGDFGKSPKYISDEFDKNDKETFMLWGHFLLKQ